MAKSHRSLRIVGTGAICLLVIAYTIYSVFTMTGMSDRVTTIFQHPYKVSAQARSLRTHLYEMQTYLPTLLATNDGNPDVIFAAVTERNAQQDQLLLQIMRDYLGGQETLDRLDQAMKALRQARKQAIEDCVGSISYEDARIYAKEKVDPLSAEVDRILQDRFLRRHRVPPAGRSGRHRKRLRHRGGFVLPFDSCPVRIYQLE